MTSSISFSKEIVTYLISHGREPLRFPISTSLDQFTPCRRKLTETWSLAMSTLIADLPHNIWKHPTSSRTEEEQAFLSYSIYIKMCHAPEMLASQIFPKMAVRPYHQQPPERYVGALRGRLELMLEDDHLSIQSKEFSGSSSWHFFCFFLNVDIFGHLMSSHWGIFPLWWQFIPQDWAYQAHDTHATEASEVGLGCPVVQKKNLEKKTVKFGKSGT